MKTKLFLIILVIFALKSSIVLTNESEPQGYSYVTCGSTIKLKHIASNFRLHSHSVNYGSGSGQQSVTGFSAIDDPNSLWLIRSTPQFPCNIGSKITNGQVIRLFHISTKKNLHSHANIKSPLSNQQEVSCYGDENNSDSGDFWQIEIIGSPVWTRTSTVLIRHVDTRAYLSCSARAKYGNPIAGQLEIAAKTAKTNEVEWLAEEGLYFKAFDIEDEEDEDY
eukprot:TRINITY_DN79_c12_g1_i1.p1 TRINITY_DN79_c12_g1~~TRINITY_DN79_c12_g1_i1.p1  ORF type:complete len:222 (+),score=97.64 TRINITY_DN79_c12_g1_i1:65-730(+)